MKFNLKKKPSQLHKQKGQLPNTKRNFKDRAMRGFEARQHPHSCLCDTGERLKGTGAVLHKAWRREGLLSG